MSSCGIANIPCFVLLIEGRELTVSTLRSTVSASTAPLSIIRSHPVPRGAALDDCARLLKRSTVLSLALHLSLVLTAVAINFWRTSGVVGTPVNEAIDISIIPLSALDTVLPKGSANTQPTSDTTPAPATKPEQSNNSATIEQPKKIVAAKSLTLKTIANKAKSDSSDRSKSTTGTLNPSPQIGVANGEAASLEQARISYQDMVATMLARAKRYPERALKRHMTGEGSIRLEISADGSLADFKIIRSTEAAILDEELRAMVERAAPFPAFPTDLQKARLALVVPVAFRLEG
jgi:TonB family protein